MNRDEGVARRDDHQIGALQRLDDAGGRARDARAVVDHPVDLVLVPSPDEPLLERERPGRSDDGRPHGVVRRGQEPRRESGPLDEVRGDRRERFPASQRLRADEMEPEVEVAEEEPSLATPLPSRLERSPRLPGPTPAALLVVQSGERVQNGVEVGRDMEAEHLDVVADVADHRQLAGVEDVVQPTRELRASHAAGEADDPHRVMASSSSAVRDPARAPRRSRSSNVSTSSTRLESVSSSKSIPSAVACARNWPALPGP